MNHRTMVKLYLAKTAGSGDNAEHGSNRIINRAGEIYSGVNINTLVRYINELLVVN